MSINPNVGPIASPQWVLVVTPRACVDAERVHRSRIGEEGDMNLPYRAGRCAALLGLATAMVTAWAAPASAAPAEGSIVNAGGPTAVAGSYIVVFKDTVARDGVDGAARGLAGRFGGTVGHTYRHAL